ncbi:uncharacterized protein LOC122850442 [Aphidius gifuensis]|uniref:uncharacterized protein LOC122850442 n=1 Tax=Aphidius gifuensis TaxID=684658 RepID=UPI001CDBF3FA|nr:uncharacterized protein LOC122850442 [Aphidius gifuensis]
MAGTYVTIPCFLPEYQSTTRSIFHDAVFYSKDREEFGNFAVFKILIEELKFLENTGIELDLPQGKTQLYFKPGLIVGDNLGLHSLFGFVEGFTANYSCCFCKMDKVQRLLATTEDNFYLRNVNNYNKDPKICNPKTTGIKEQCCFNGVGDFHVVSNLCCDIMHDLIEGVCVFDMVAIISNFIENGYFTLNELNNCLKNFYYGIVDSDNVPPAIDSGALNKNKIKMSASELWTFVRYFGIIIGDLIPEDNAVWQVYLNLRQLLALVTSTTISKKHIPMLKNLVQQHNYLARNVLKRQLFNKDHHLIHYATIIDTSGPAVNF